MCGTSCFVCPRVRVEKCCLLTLLHRSMQYLPNDSTGYYLFPLIPFPTLKGDVLRRRVTEDEVTTALLGFVLRNSSPYAESLILLSFKPNHLFVICDFCEVFLKAPLFSYGCDWRLNPRRDSSSRLTTAFLPASSSVKYGAEIISLFPFS